MEFDNIRIAGHPVTVIFNGPKYIFYSRFFGLVAYADRQEPFYDDVKRFKLYTGNHHCQGGSLTETVIFRACAKHIRKSENKHLPFDVEIEHLNGHDLAAACMRITLEN